MSATVYGARFEAVGPLRSHFMCIMCVSKRLERVSGPPGMEPGRQTAACEANALLQGGCGGGVQVEELRAYHSTEPTRKIGDSTRTSSLAAKLPMRHCGQGMQQDTAWRMVCALGRWLVLAGTAVAGLPASGAARPTPSGMRAARPLRRCWAPAARPRRARHRASIPGGWPCRGMGEWGVSNRTSSAAPEVGPRGS